MMLPKERVLNAILGKEVDHIPATCVNSTATLDQMEKIGVYWPEAHVNPEKMAKLAAAAYEIAGLETAKVPFDQAVEAEALGCTIHMPGTKDTFPAVKATPFKERLEQIEKPSDFLERGRVPVVVKAVKMLSLNVGDKLPVMAAIVGPFTLLSHLTGLVGLFKLMKKEPEKVFSLLQIPIKVAVEYGNTLIDSGADVIVIEDMGASGQNIGPNNFDLYAKPALQKVIEGLHGLVVLHICGFCDATLGSMVETGAHAISIDAKTDAKIAKKKGKGKVTVIGNVDTKVLLEGTPPIVRDESIRALKDGVDLLAPACSLDAHTPLANIEAMVNVAGESAKKY